MSTEKQLGRRRFLGATAAVVTSAGVVGAVGLGAARRGSARFEGLQGYPDAPTAVDVAFAGRVGAEVGQAELFVVTPRETLAYDLGAIAVRDGRARVETTLVYPYDDLVAGRYDYHLKVTVGGQVAATEAPAGFGVRPFRWFS